jgi:hypothetical protein
MGVRCGESTCALLFSKPKKMVSYDLNDDHFAFKNDIYNYCKKNYINYEFIIADTLNIEIENTDLLFVDTLHTYNQLITELNKHSKKVSKYIILHDTTTFGYQDEIIYSNASNIVKNMKNEKQGLIVAVQDFIKTNKNWNVYKKYENNNGLTILNRVDNENTLHQ